MADDRPLFKRSMTVYKVIINHTLFHNLHKCVIFTFALFVTHSFILVTPAQYVPLCLIKSIVLSIVVYRKLIIRIIYCLM